MTLPGTAPKPASSTNLSSASSTRAWHPLASQFKGYSKVVLPVLGFRKYRCRPSTSSPPASCRQRFTAPSSSPP